MKKLHKKLWLFIIFSVVFSIVSKCDKSPTEPEESIPWSKITGKIAYSRSYHSLFIIDGEAQKVKLVKESNNIYFTELAWSNDGNKIFFDSADYGLCSINTDGSNFRVIYNSNVIDCPACSRDGRLAYWYKNTTAWPQIWIDGKYFLGQLDKIRCNWTRPAWSPDCKFLVISLADSTSQGALYKVRLSDKSMIPLLQGSGEYNQEIFNDPVYSPDGSKIVFTKWFPSINDSNHEIWTINSDGTNPIQLTTGFDDWYPAWSPDGEKIAFTRGHAINSRIFIMNADGSDVTQVTQNEGQYPTWIQ